MRAVTASVFVLAALTLPAAPANAVHGTGQHGCPPPFTPHTEAEQYALAASMGVPAEEVAATLEHFDRAGDGILCFMWMPDGHPNIIDNRSAHR